MIDDAMCIMMVLWKSLEKILMSYH